MKGHLSVVSPLSREPSAVLQNAPPFFELGGAAAFGLAAVHLISSALGSSAFVVAISPYTFSPLTAIATGVGLVWTGRQLRLRQRSSAYGAVMAAASIVIDQLASPVTSAAAMAFGVAGLVLLGALWDELE